MVPALLGSALAEEASVRLADVVGVYRSPVVIERPEETIRTENILEIIRHDQDNAYIRVRLNHPVTGNLCSLWGIAELRDTRLTYQSIGDEEKTSSRCNLSVRVETSEIRFEDQGRQCERQLCGANTHFSEFVFKRSGRRPIAYLERIEESRQYRQAVEEYGLLIQSRATQDSGLKQP